MCECSLGVYTPVTESYIFLGGGGIDRCYDDEILPKGIFSKCGVLIEHNKLLVRGNEETIKEGIDKLREMVRGKGVIVKVPMRGREYGN